MSWPRKTTIVICNTDYTTLVSTTFDKISKTFRYSVVQKKCPWCFQLKKFAQIFQSLWIHWTTITRLARSAEFNVYLFYLFFIFKCDVFIVDRSVVIATQCSDVFSVDSGWYRFDLIDLIGFFFAKNVSALTWEINCYPNCHIAWGKLWGWCRCDRLELPARRTQRMNNNRISSVSHQFVYSERTNRLQC